MIAATVMLMLFGALFFICHQATRAMLKGASQSGMLADVQVLGQRWRNAVQKSREDSLSMTANSQAMAILSAEDDNGRFQYEVGATQPRWQEYLIFYHVPTERLLKTRSVSVLGTSRELASGPIETYASGDPLEDYLFDGKGVLRRVDQLAFSQPEPSTLKLSLSLSEKGSHSQRPESLSLTILATFRN